MSSLTVPGRVTLPGGQVLTTSTAVTISTTALGVDPSTSTNADFAQDIAWFPGAKVGSAYGAAGAGLPAWTDHWVAPMVAAGFWVTFSAKDFNLAAYTAHWDAAPPPPAGRKWQYIPYHECNKPAAQSPPSLSAWRSFYTSLMSAWLAHPKKAWIEIGPCFSWFPAVQTPSTEGTPWQQWTQGLAPPHFVAWDQYRANGAPSDPEQFVAIPVQSRTTLGAPKLFVREFGCASSQSDATSAAFINAVVPVYKAHNFESVAYYQYTLGTSGARIDPVNRPLAFAAWQAAVANQ